MTELTVHLSKGNGDLFLFCADCQTAVGRWTPPVSVADIGAAEMEHAAHHITILLETS